VRTLSRRHSVRSEESLYLLLSLLLPVLIVAFVVVIPEGDLRLQLPVFVVLPQRSQGKESASAILVSHPAQPKTRKKRAARTDCSFP
jgi:hypothetical protein